MNTKQTPCECCGRSDAIVYAYGEADDTGHIWTHYTCEQCQGHCSSDEQGNPVHMRAGWDGRPETFEAYRAPREGREGNS